MPSDPARPSYTPGQRRLLTALAGLVVAALAGGAFAVTYDTLRELAVGGRVSSRWAPLYPAMADTLTAMTILSLAVTRNARWWTRLLRWTLLVLLVAGGAAISVQHSVQGFAELPDDALRAGVAVAPHIMLVIAVWLWLTMFKQIRVARPAAEPVPVETQRGHVKVLEPATPPLALEPPAEAEPEPEPFAFLDDPDPLIPFPREDPDPLAPEPAEPDPTPHDRTVPDEPAEPSGDGQAEADDGGEPEAGESVEPEVAAVETGGGAEEAAAEAGPPPLDPLPEPRATLLPTDVELVRSSERGAEERPAASATRPDMVLPGPDEDDHDGDEDDHDGPAADRAEDPDAGDRPAKDWNPPPASNFRSGPTPPAD